METTQEMAFASAAQAVRSAEDVEALVRPLLEALQAATGYESTYLTLIHWDTALQEIRYSLNTGDLEIPEGLQVDWTDTLCRRALLGGPPVVEDAGVTYPDSTAAQALGIKGYASVPVTLGDGETVGTLCGASTQLIAESSAKRDLLALFSVLIGHAIERERILADERDRTVAAEGRLRNRLQSIAAAEHMLKTPLTVLQGWARMFTRKGDELTPAQRTEGIAAISRSADSMRDLVDQLLASTRDDFRLGDNLHFQVLDVAPVVERLITAHEAASGGQKWTSQVTGPLISRVDVGSFEQLISHLMDNSIKYGGPEATVHIEATTDGSGALTVILADTGPGMPDGGDVFEPFSRAAAADRTDSVGIGLHVVKTLADAHGATISFTRTDPHGATATVTFPQP